MKYAFKKARYKILILLFDVFGTAIFFFVRLFKKKSPSNPAKILVIRLDHIGDFVCTTPILKNLKARFPDAKITVLINSASKDLAFRNPHVDKAISFSPFYLARKESSSSLKGLLRVIKDIRNIGFDLGIEPRGDLLSILLMWLGAVKYRAGYGITGGSFLLNKVCRYNDSKHVVERNLAVLEALNIPIADRSPEVYFNDKDKDTVEKLVAVTGSDKAIILHPFAGTKAKVWPMGNFQTLIDMLKKDGCDIMLVGSKEDEGSFANVVDMRGRLNLPQLAYLIKRVGFFVGLDSGPANIAAALDIPSIIICSGTNIPQLWIPNKGNVKFIYRDTECKPCENKICPLEKGNKCLSDISVDDVMAKIKEVMR